MALAHLKRAGEALSTAAMELRRAIRLADEDTGALSLLEAAGSDLYAMEKRMKAALEEAQGLVVRPTVTEVKDDE